MTFTSRRVWLKVRSRGWSGGVRRQCSAGKCRCIVSDARSSVANVTADEERAFHLAANAAACRFATAIASSLGSVSPTSKIAQRSAFGSSWLWADTSANTFRARWTRQRWRRLVPTCSVGRGGRRR